MSESLRDIELTGDASSVAILREVYRALSGGQELPTEPTDTLSAGMFAYYVMTYLAPNGDRLEVTEIADYGSWHKAEVPHLVVGGIIVEDVGTPRSQHVVFRILADAARIDEVSETVKRIAIANGLTFVKWGAGDEPGPGAPGPPDRLAFRTRGSR